MLTDVAADTPNCHQLPPPQCHWPAAYHDDAVGVGWCTTGRIQHRRRVQRRPEDPATNPNIAEFGNVDPVLLLRARTWFLEVYSIKYEAECDRNGL